VTPSPHPEPEQATQPPPEFTAEAAPEADADSVKETASPEGSPSSWHLAAAVAGWVLPGLGHFLLGQQKRAVILVISIGTLWLIGLFVGGISVIDRNNQPAWFLGQMLIAPSTVADWYRDQMVADQLMAGRSFDPVDEPPFEPALGRAHEQGTLFTCMAGLLNLLAMIDVLYREPRNQPQRTPRHGDTEKKNRKSEKRETNPS
jgi:TM2 domain-containing membrane protein YozV